MLLKSNTTDYIMYNNIITHYYTFTHFYTLPTKCCIILHMGKCMIVDIWKIRIIGSAVPGRDH